MTPFPVPSASRHMACSNKYMLVYLYMKNTSVDCHRGADYWVSLLRNMDPLWNVANLKVFVSGCFSGLGNINFAWGGIVWIKNAVSSHLCTITRFEANLGPSQNTQCSKNASLASNVKRTEVTLKYYFCAHIVYKNGRKQPIVPYKQTNFNEIIMFSWLFGS